jgi:hypothetical protein
MFQSSSAASEFTSFRARTALAVAAFAFLIGFSSLPASHAATAKKYTPMDRVLDKCSLTSQIIGQRIDDPVAPTASLCINGALAVTDPNYNRVLMSSTGTGVGTGVVGNCSLSGSGTATEYDAYGFNLTGCAAFPTAVDISLCGPAGCVAPGALDSAVTLYRNVAAGDPLTANGGLPAVFNPASPCTNARAANDDSGTTPTSAGGSTCSQTGSCMAQCAAPATTANSELRRNLGNGRFTVVVTGFGNATVGSYNLYINAPAAGCAVALAPTAANVSVSGRVMRPDGYGVSHAIVVLTDVNGVARTVRTSSLGYYTFDQVPSGETYVVGVSSKQYQFDTQTISVASELSNVDFTAVDK